MQLAELDGLAIGSRVDVKLDKVQIVVSDVSVDVGFDFKEGAIVGAEDFLEENQDLLLDREVYANGTPG